MNMELGTISNARMVTVSIIQIAVLIIAVASVWYYIKQISRTALIFIILLLTLIGITALAPYFSPMANGRGNDHVSSIINILVLAAVLYVIQTSREARVNREHRQSLQEIELAMLSGLGHKGVITTMLNRLTDTLAVDAAAIILPGTTAEQGCSVILCRIEGEFQHYLEQPANDLIMSVCEKRKPLVIAAIKKNEQDELLSAIRNQGFASYVGAPVFLKGGIPAGVLMLFHRNPRGYTPRDLAFVRTVTNQVGITLDRKRLMDRITEMNFEAVRALVSAIESRDVYTRGHSIQVAELSVAVAREMDFSPRELTLLEFAGLLHDVGKIAVPEKILQKKSSLTEDEWQIVRQHPIISAKIIEPISNLKQIHNWILYHHERFDGSGYPEKIAGKSIPLASRIMAVCDTYSAMTSNRPYRTALARGTALKEIRLVAGMQLDPSVVETFVRLYG